MKNSRINFSLLAYFLCCSLIIGAAFSYPKWSKSHTEATLSWDVMGFYLYLPAIFIYKDLKQLRFKDEILKKYRPTGSFYQAYSHPNGNYVMKYPIGLAVLYSPFFAVASIIAKTGAYEVDGFSFPYQLMISWGGILMAFLGLWISRLNLLKYFGQTETAITLILLVFGTNYLNYSAIGGAHTHNWLFTIYAILIYFTIRWHEDPSFGRSIAIGVCIGLATITRPTDIIAFLIPSFWGLSSVSARLKLFGQHWKKLLLTGITILLIGSLQMIYWKYAAGKWLEYSYQDQGFNFLKPHFYNCFFSYRKGWLVYTPMMSLALIGFYFLYKKNRQLFWPCVIFSFLNIYIAFSWNIWWYGGSFGQRAMIQGYAVLLFPMAAFWYYVLKSKWIKWLFASIALFFIWLNLIQTYQAHFNGVMDPEYMTRAYYWRIFGKTKIRPADKKLLDTDEDFVGPRNAIRTLYFNDFENEIDSTAVVGKPVKSGERAIYLDEKRQFTPSYHPEQLPESGQWIRLSAHFRTPKKEWDTWRMAQLTASFEKQGEMIKQRMVRVHRFLPPNQWKEIWLDTQVPDKSFDALKVYLWNANGNKSLFIDDLKIEAFEP